MEAEALSMLLVGHSFIHNNNNNTLLKHRQIQDCCLIHEDKLAL